MPEHHMQDFLIGLPHAYSAKPHHVHCGLFNIRAHQAVSRLKIPALQGQIGCQQGSIHSHGDFGCTGWFRAITHNSRAGSQSVTDCGGYFLKIPAAEPGYRRSRSAGSADSPAKCREATNPGLQLNCNQIRKNQSPIQPFIIRAKLLSIDDNRQTNRKPLIAGTGIDNYRHGASPHSGITAGRGKGLCPGSHIVAPVLDQARAYSAAIAIGDSFPGNRAVVLDLAIQQILYFPDVNRGSIIKNSMQIQSRLTAVGGFSFWTGSCLQSDRNPILFRAHNICMAAGHFNKRALVLSGHFDKNIQIGNVFQKFNIAYPLRQQLVHPMELFRRHL